MGCGDYRVGCGDYRVGCDDYRVGCGDYRVGGGIIPLGGGIIPLGGDITAPSHKFGHIPGARQWRLLWAVIVGFRPIGPFENP